MFKIFKDRYFWIIVILTASLGLLIYAANIHFLSWLPYREEPHLIYMALERILFLLIVVIASLRFGFTGGLAVCLSVGFIALPHIINVLSFSSQPDMVIEIIIVGVLGVPLSWLISVYELSKKRLRESYEQLERRVEERTKELEQELTEHKHTMDKLLQSEERYRSLIDLGTEIGEAVVMLEDTTRGEGIQVFISDQWSRITGYPKKELLGKPFFDLLHPECRQAFIDRHRKKIRGEVTPGLFEMTVIKKNGSEVPIELTSALTLYQGRHVSVSYIRDVTENKKDKQRLKQAAEEWNKTFDSIMDSVSIIDNDCNLLRVNRAFSSFTKMKPQQLIGKKCYEVVHGTKEPIPDCPHQRTLITGKPAIVELKDPRSGVFLEISTSPIFDDNDEVIRTVHIAKNITKRKQNEEAIKHLAFHDALTGLPNRTLFTDLTNMALAHARRNKEKLAVIMLDLDKFKLINDTYGHGTGDQLLKAVSDRIKGALRASDMVCRMGGDEFIILLHDITNQEDITKIAIKISSLFQIPFVLNGNELQITSSIGIAIYPDNGRKTDELIINADRAMYHSKVKGRNQWQLFTTAMSKEHLLKE